MKSDTVYTPSDSCDTLPCPKPIPRLTNAGSILDTSRKQVMERRQIGLTRLYDILSDPDVVDPDIYELRSIHIEIDEAVKEAYAIDEDQDKAIVDFEDKIASAPLPRWQEVNLSHGFHETPQGTRFTISQQARVDVLDKLLALNHYRHQQELGQNLHSKRYRSKLRPPRAVVESSAGPDDGGLFPPSGALF